MNTKLWNSGLESDKDLARQRKRKLSYVSNIYVVNDPGAPECTGRVFLYKYGMKIFDKIQAKMSPKFEEDEVINPFDFWEGANFKLRVKKVQEFPNYDDSEFATPGPLFKEDAKLEEIWKQQYPLLELNDPKHFKSYEDLKTLLNRVIGVDGVVKHAAPMRTVVERADPDTPPWADEKAQVHETSLPPKQSEQKPQQFDKSNEDMSAYFRSLAEKSR